MHSFILSNSEDCKLGGDVGLCSVDGSPCDSPCDFALFFFLPNGRKERFPDAEVEADEELLALAQLVFLPSRGLCVCSSELFDDMDDAGMLTYVEYIYVSPDRSRRSFR